MTNCVNSFNLHRKFGNSTEEKKNDRRTHNDVISYDVTMIFPDPGIAFGTAFGSACVYSEKRPGQAAAETRVMKWLFVA